MLVRRLRLGDYRSWAAVDIPLEPGITVFVGPNGNGKTNLLEALHYLATLGSHRVSSDAPLVREGCDSAHIAAEVENDGRALAVGIDINISGRNRVTINKAPRPRPRDILGVLRVVLFAPEDLLLVRGDPADRRRYLDEVIATHSTVAAGTKADYDKVLRQRSALLKTAGSVLRRGGSDSEDALSTLGVWDTQLAALGGQLTADRLRIVSELEPIVAKVYDAIAPGSRPAGLRYVSAAGPDITADSSVADITEMLLQQAKDLREKEIQRGVTLVGPHRDELALRLGEQPVKGFASHGESWSVALALRLATLDYERERGYEPVLLLDDVFAELDAARRSKLAEVAATSTQVLITAAVPQDIPAELHGRTVGVRMHADDTGRVSLVESHSDETATGTSGGQNEISTAGTQFVDDVGDE